MLLLCREVCGQVLIIVCADLYTNKIFARVMANKTSAETKRCLKEIFAEARCLPVQIESDQGLLLPFAYAYVLTAERSTIPPPGSEFRGLKAWFDEMKIVWHEKIGDNKAAGNLPPSAPRNKYSIFLAEPPASFSLPILRSRRKRDSKDQEANPRQSARTRQPGLGQPIASYCRSLEFHSVSRLRRSQTRRCQLHLRHAIGRAAAVLPIGHVARHEKEERQI